MSPPNQTFLSPDLTAQDAHKVWFLSHKVRAEVCWHGRQEIRAVMDRVSEDGEPEALNGVSEAAETDF